MTNKNQSGGGCCGGAAKAAQNEQARPTGSVVHDMGCGCGHSKGTATDISISEPVAAENADGGCCGGK